MDRVALKYLKQFFESIDSLVLKLQRDHTTYVSGLPVVLGWVRDLNNPGKNMICSYSVGHESLKISYKFSSEDVVLASVGVCFIKEKGWDFSLEDLSHFKKILKDLGHKNYFVRKYSITESRKRDKIVI